MKTLFEYLLSKKKKQIQKTSKLEAWESYGGTKYIPADIIYQYIIDALELNWLKAEDILKEFEIPLGSKNHSIKEKSEYKKYSKFEASLREILEQSAYPNKIDEILYTLYDNYLPIFDEIAHEDKN